MDLSKNGFRGFFTIEMQKNVYYYILIQRKETCVMQKLPQCHLSRNPTPTTDYVNLHSSSFLK